MAEQEQWNNDVPANYVKKRMAARRAEKERRARLAREMAERARAAAQQEQDELVGFGEPLAEESLPQRAPAPGARAPRAPRPPVYVPPSRSIPQHQSGVAGVALRKSKRKSRKSKAKTRKSRRR